MVKLVIVKNPFQPWSDREIKHVPYGFNVRQMAEYGGFKGTEILCTVNGETVQMDENYVIPDNQMVVMSAVVGKGRGGKILGMVVGIALMVVGGLGAAGTIALASGKALSIGIGIAMGMAGSFLMSYSQSAYAKSIGAPSFETSTNDATYSWGGVQTMEGQNNPVTLTYGKVKSGGQTIGKFVNVVDNKEYLNWLVSAGEGELEFSDIMLNDNPVDYYEGVDVETRNGTNDQTIISNFNDTYFTKQLGYQLLNDYRTETCQGNATQGIVFKIEFSSGLYYGNDKGGLDEAWVDISAEYRKVGDNWKSFFIGDFYKYELQDAPEGLSVTNDVQEGTYTITYNYDEEYDDDSYYTTIRFNGKSLGNIWIYKGTPKNIGNFNINVDDLIKEDQTYTFTVVRTEEKAARSERITGKQSSALRKEYRVDNLEAGEYEVRVRVVNRSHEVDNSRASVRCYWSGLTSIVYDDFCYPNIALIGIKALATDQISGAPKLTFIKERKYVWVWNEINNKYEQKPSNNPAWASYDMLHQCSRLMNINTGEYEYEVRGVPAKHIIYEHFDEWARFCDDKGLKINIEITQCGEMLETINGQIALCGRGSVLRFGTRYGAIWDCVKQPVQMFGMGNIVSGTLKEDFLKTTDRANCVEVTYNDENMDYERNVITIYSDDFDNDAEQKTAQVTYNGITSYEQAFREGKYQLYSNKYILRTVSFEANIDAIACTVGDVVLVSHDVPKWANSGRIYSVDVSKNSMVLPVEIENPVGQYRIMYRTVNDNLYTSDITISKNENGWCTVVCKSKFKSGDLPQANDVFDIALTNTGSKPFVVKSISRANDFTRNIVCTEYNENIYNENYDIPPVQYSVDNSQQAQNVTGLNASQIAYKDTTDGALKSRLFASWESPENGGRFTVLISTDKNYWRLLQSNIQENHIETDVEYGNEYYIKVITVLGISKSTGVISDSIKIGEDVLPPNVTSLDVELLKDGTRKYHWGFQYPTPNDIAGFRMKYIQGDKPDWTNAYDVQEGLITSQPYETTTVRQGKHCVMIKAVDNAGQESEGYAFCSVNFGTPTTDNLLTRKVYVDNNVTDIRQIDTNGVVYSDGYIHSKQTSNYYKNKNDYFWGNATDNHWSEFYQEFYLKATFIVPTSGYFWLDYEIEGVYNLTYKIRNKDKMFKPYSAKTFVDAGDVIDILFESKNSETDTVLKRLILIVDTPTIQERFSNISITTTGTVLPVQTELYKTINVTNNSVYHNGYAYYGVEVTEDDPCIIKAYGMSVDDTDFQLKKTYLNCDVDVTWNGYSVIQYGTGRYDRNNFDKTRFN